jgi:hypothetical protein
MENKMSQANSEGVAEFIRLVEELSELTEDMSSYERKMIEDSFDRIGKFGDKTFVTEVQLDFVRQLYKRVL